MHTTHERTGHLSTPRRSLLQLCAGILDAVSRICMLLAGIAMVLLIGIFGWLVFGRYVLNSTPTWVEQLSLLLIVYITFLGAAVGVRQNTHLSIDFIREMFPRTPRAVMAYISDAILVILGGFMAWQGYLLVGTNTRRAIPMLGVTESWRAAPLVICGVLMVLFAAYRIVERLSAAEHDGE